MSRRARGYSPYPTRVRGRLARPSITPKFYSQEQSVEFEKEDRERKLREQSERQRRTRRDRALRVEEIKSELGEDEYNRRKKELREQQQLEKERLRKQQAKKNRIDTINRRREKQRMMNEINKELRENEYVMKMHEKHGTKPIEGVYESWQKAPTIKPTFFPISTIYDQPTPYKRGSRLCKNKMCEISKDCHETLFTKKPKCTTEELRGYLENRGLITFGTRDELIKRIQYHNKMLNRERGYNIRRTLCKDYITMIPNVMNVIDKKRDIIRSQFKGINNSNWVSEMNSRAMERLFTLYDRYFFDGKLKSAFSKSGYHLHMAWDEDIRTGLSTEAAVITITCPKCEKDGFCERCSRHLIMHFRSRHFQRKFDEDGYQQNPTFGEALETDAFRAIMYTFEHELVHAIIEILCRPEAFNYRGRAKREQCDMDSFHTDTFVRILKNVFRHDDIYSSVPSRGLKYEEWKTDENLEEEEDMFNARKRYGRDLIEYKRKGAIDRARKRGDLGLIMPAKGEWGSERAWREQNVPGLKHSESESESESDDDDVDPHNSSIASPLDVDPHSSSISSSLDKPSMVKSIFGAITGWLRNE